MKLYKQMGGWNPLATTHGEFFAWLSVVTSSVNRLQNKLLHTTMPDRMHFSLSDH